MLSVLWIIVFLLIFFFNFCSHGNSPEYVEIPVLLVDGSVLLL